MKPVVKWVGGKRQLLKYINEMLPKNFNRYYEPFVGGGAVLFSLAVDNAHINDLNTDLVTLYNVLKDKTKCNKLVKELDKHELNHSSDYFYEVRELDRSEDYKELKDYEVAARTVYLNKAGFNGLYRVNSKGQFNVPFGKKEKVNTYELDNVLEIHEYFNRTNIKITNLDFNLALEDVKENDFVYFDPPYDKLKSDTFTSYQKSDFTQDDQVRLFNLYDSLSKKGAFVMLSNHNTEFIRDLYKDYNITIVKANRMINSDPTKRGKIEEVIITNYEVNLNEEIV